MIRIVIKSLKYAFQTRRAWLFTSIARTRARYSRTILGSFWLGISNLLFILVLGFVYGIVFQADNFKNYYIYLGLGFSIWNSIGESINGAPKIFENNSSNLLNSTVGPLYYALEEWAFQVQTFLQSFILVIFALSILDPNLLKNLLIFAPLNLINLIIFIFWLPLFVSLSAIKYADVYQLVPIITQLLFLLSPILYAEKNLGKLSGLANLNPVYKVLALFRDSIINGNFYLRESLILLFINLIMVFLSLILLDKRKSTLIYYL